MAACCARCTMTADMDTVDTTADATMASIITLVTCMAEPRSEATYTRLCGSSAGTSVAASVAVAHT